MASAIGVSGSDSFNIDVLDVNIGTTTTGSTLFAVAIRQNSVAFTSITDTYTNTWTQIGSEATSGWPAACRVYRAENITGGTNHTITQTIGGSTWNALAIVEVTGLSTSPFDQFVDFSTDSSSPFTSGTTSATTQAAEMALCAIWCRESSSAETITWGNGYALAVQQSTGVSAVIAIGYKSLSSTGTQQSSVTLANNTTAVSWLATFKDASGGSSIAPLAMHSYRSRR